MRCYILSACRRARDSNAIRAEYSPDPVKLFVTLPNGKVVSVHTTLGITVKCLLTEAQPENVRLHKAIRAINWVAFALHAVALGMASLRIQLMLVLLLLLSTILVVQRIGSDESHVGRYLRIIQTDDANVDTRSKAYLKLNLNTSEEESMIKWDLLPLESNKIWWRKYRTLQVDEETRPLEGARSQWFMAKGNQ